MIPGSAHVESVERCPVQRWSCGLPQVRQGTTLRSMNSVRWRFPSGMVLSDMVSLTVWVRADEKPEPLTHGERRRIEVEVTLGRLVEHLALNEAGK